MEKGRREGGAGGGGGIVYSSRGAGACGTSFCRKANVVIIGDTGISDIIIGVTGISDVP